MSWISNFFMGGFDCAVMRDKNICAGARQKTDSAAPAPEPRLGMPVTGRSHYDDGSSSCSAGSDVGGYHHDQFAPSPYDYMSNAYRLPSPGFSVESLHPTLQSMPDLPFTHQHAGHFGAPFDMGGFFQQGGSSASSAYTDGIDDVPRDFYKKLGVLASRDRMVQASILRRDSSWSMSSPASRFLQACIRDNYSEAASIWRTLSPQERRDLLETYQRGPPSADYFVNVMLEHNRVEVSDSSSHASEVDQRRSELLDIFDVRSEDLR